MDQHIRSILAKREAYDKKQAAAAKAAKQAEQTRARNVRAIHSMMRGA